MIRTFLFVNEDRVTGAFLSEHSGIWLQGALGCTKDCRGGSVRVSAAFEVVLAG